MKQQRLLERIRGGGDDPILPGAREYEAEIRSISRYLYRVFNTRKGSVSMNPEFGVPDYSSMASRLSTANVSTITDIENGLKEAIKCYEPRLKNPRVKILDKGEYDIDLVIEIHAEMKTPGGFEPVDFKVRMKADGSVQVRG